MATLLIIKGPNLGQRFTLDEETNVVGRNPDVAVHLPSQVVSRRHAQIFSESGDFFVEDLAASTARSSTGGRLVGSRLLTDGDQLELCEYVLVFHDDPPAGTSTSAILEQVSVGTNNAALFAENPAQKLQTVLHLAQHLGQTLEVQPLLDNLLHHLLQLFPLADRALAVLCEGSRLVVKAQRSRRRGEEDFPFSRTVVRQALEDGVGLLSDDLQSDERFRVSGTVGATRSASLLCVPLFGHDHKPLGALQVDCSRPGQKFNGEHLRLLTTVALLAAVALENVALNEVRVRAEGLRRDLALGREIQMGFLPTDFSAPPGASYEIFAGIHPAKEVSGDLYDFFPLDEDRFVFLVGDVSDKGISAALFMVKVQTLTRHLVPGAASPAAALRRLNDALAANNPSSMFVTLTLGIYEARTGVVVLASGGHPRPLLRRPDGSVVEVAMPVGRLLGCFEGDPDVRDLRLTLDHGETLILYSDGYTEAMAPASKMMLGLAALREMMGGAGAQRPLAECAAQARQTVERFTGGADLQDDLTLLLLRRS